jgi:DNA-binding CsgD family transcriptional regulator
MIWWPDVVRHEEIQDTAEGRFVLGSRIAPSFARTRELHRIVRLIADGTSVEIVGTRFSGRTELLRRLVVSLESAGRMTVAIRGIGERLQLEAIRLGLGPDSHIRKTNPASHATPGSSALSQLTAHLGTGPSAILIDDAEFLDDASWSVVEAAHKTLGTPVVAVTLRRPPSDESRNRLARMASPVTQQVVSPLPRAAIHDLLESRVSGRVSAALTSRIHVDSAGIPGIVTAIVDAAQRSGAMRRSGSVWTCETDVWSSELNGTFEALLLSFRHEIREALEVLAMAGHGDIVEAAELVGRDRVEYLEAAGLISVFALQGRHRFEICPPGLRDYFTNLDGSARKSWRAGEAGSVLGSKAKLDSGARIDAASAAGRFSDRTFADRIFASGRGLTITDAVQILNEHLGGPSATLSDSEMGDVIARTSLSDAAIEDELEFRHLHSRWLVASGAPREAVLGALTPSKVADDSLRRALGYLRQTVLLEQDGTGGCHLLDVAPSQADADIGNLTARVCAGLAHAITARGNEALAFVADFPADAPRFLRTHADYARGLALYGSGRAAEAADWAASRIDLALHDRDPASLVAHSYVAALSHAAGGRFEESAEVAALAISSQVRSCGLLFSPERALFATAAVVALRSGSRTSAAAYQDRLAQLPLCSEALPVGAPEFADAARLAVGGDTRGAARMYARVGRRLDGNGFALAAGSALMLSLLSEYDPRIGQEFRHRAERMGGPLFAALLDGRGAGHARDHEGLVDAARRLREHDAVREALRCFTEARRLLRKSGDVSRAEAVYAEIEDLLGSAVPEFETAGVRGDSRLGITRREKEIIALVSEGLANSDIAERVGISVRTVETHLRNIRRKTGAADRDALRLFGAV